MGNYTFLKPDEIFSKIRIAANTKENINIVQVMPFIKKLRNERHSSILTAGSINKINDEYFLTINKRKFIQKFKYENTEEDLLIMINDENIIHIQNSKSLVCNGTFFACPKQILANLYSKCQFTGEFFPISAFIFALKIIFILFK
jgi:hypothetical protein